MVLIFHKLRILDLGLGKITEETKTLVVDEMERSIEEIGRTRFTDELRRFKEEQDARDKREAELKKLLEDILEGKRTIPQDEPRQVPWITPWLPLQPIDPHPWQPYVGDPLPDQRPRTGDPLPQYPWTITYLCNTTNKVKLESVSGVTGNVVSCGNIGVNSTGYATPDVGPPTAISASLMSVYAG